MDLGFALWYAVAAVIGWVILYWVIRKAVAAGLREERELLERRARDQHPQVRSHLDADGL